VSLLLDRGADPIKPTGGSFSATPLEYAVKRGHMGVSRELAKTKKGQGMIQCQASQQDGRENLLYCAVRSGNEALCDEMIEKYKFNVDATATTASWTPLAMAISCGHVHLARRLVQRHKVSTDDHMELLRAAYQGFQLRSDTFSFVVEELQVNINAVDDEGDTFFHSKAIFDYLDTNSLLLLLLLENLLALGYNFRGVKETNGTFLHSMLSMTGLYSGDEKVLPLVIAFLIGKVRIDVNAQDHEGQTALRIVVGAALEFGFLSKRFKNNIEVTTRPLLDNGADRTLRDRRGRTAYDYLQENRGIRFEECQMMQETLGNYSTVPSSI
jgi:ankyrin repeat protein